MLAKASKACPHVNISSVLMIALNKGVCGGESGSGCLFSELLYTVCFLGMKGEPGTIGKVTQGDKGKSVL